MINLDGALVATKLEAICAEKHQDYIARYQRPAALGVLWVGDNEASAAYIQHKQKTAQRLGMDFQLLHFPARIPYPEIISEMMSWQKAFDGVIVQLPLPAGHDAHTYLSCVPAEKDVDGLNPYHRGIFTACTPLGCLCLLTYYGIEVKGRHCVVVGKSDLVGRPLANLLLTYNATVTVTHLDTKDLPFFTRQGEILFVCAGCKHLITQDHVNHNAIIIDIGIHRTEKGLTGDVDPHIRVKALSPVPRGVGPLTVTSLMWNTLTAAFRKQGQRLCVNDLLGKLSELNSETIIK